MREIKFRAFHSYKGKNGQMKYNVGVHPFMIFRLSDAELIEKGEYDDNTGDLVVSPNSYTVMQYTGKQDNDGNELWEGDLVGVFMDRLGESYPSFKENDYLVCEVVFENGGFHAINYKKEMQFPLWAVAKEALIKLGNIHENADLIQ